MKLRIIASFFIVGLVVSALFISCGGSGAHDAHTVEQEKPDVHAAPDDGDNMLMSGKSNCPPPNLKIDAALNKKYCGSDECLFDFAGYTWWSNFHFRGSGSWWWSNDQGTSFSPTLAKVSSDGIHLKVGKADLGGGSEWMSSEVVALFKSGTREVVNFGYGKYLVSAKILSGSPSWGELDPNVAFGVFTYDDATPTGVNKYRELDLAEISTWGGCSNVLDKNLCVGNAQFALQPWGALSNTRNVHRYTINKVKEITLVMEWNAANKPVTFSQYDGKYTLNNLPKNPNNTWTTSAEHNPYIPDNGCQLFHINFWMGNYGQGKKHPGPSNGLEHEVVVTNFVYQPN